MRTERRARKSCTDVRNVSLSSRRPVQQVEDGGGGGGRVAAVAAHEAARAAVWETQLVRARVRDERTAGQRRLQVRVRATCKFTVFVKTCDYRAENCSAVVFQLQLQIFGVGDMRFKEGE